MSLKRETPKQSEQYDVGNLKDQVLQNTILRKRIIGVLIVVWVALTSAGYVYYRSEYSRSSNDWTSFWIGETIAGVWLVFGIVQVFRETWKS